MTPNTTKVQIDVLNLDVLRKAVAILGDAREAICSGMSEGWDVFSDDTRDEMRQIIERIDGLALDA